MKDSIPPQRSQGDEGPYRAIFNASDEPMVLRDAEFRIVDVNPAWEAMSGYRRSEVVGLASLTFSDADQQDRRLAMHARALAGEQLRLEVKGTSKDGRVFVVDVRLIPIRFRGEPHVLQIGIDITQRKAAEDRLRASEADYRAIFNASDESMMIRDAEFRVVDVNPAWEAMSGYSRDRLVGIDRTVFSGPEQLVKRRAQHARALAGERSQFEVRGRGKDGSEFVREVRLMPIEFRGKPHVLQIGNDITERKAAEERLRASEEHYRAIFNASDDPMLLRDADFRIVDVNAAYEARSGISRADVLGLDRLTVSDPSQLEERRELHARALAGEKVQFEMRGVGRDGRSYVIEVRLLPMQFRGRPHVLHIGQEITERVNTESERALLEAQLRQAQKMEAIGQLTGGIAHDFNNILQGIMGNLTLAWERKEQLGDALLGKYLDRAQHSAQRARELIGQMLTFSRGQPGKRRPVALPELVRDACKLLRSTLPSTIDLRLSLDEAVPLLELDPVQVEQVVLNLCINARDAMDGTGAIRIGLKPVARVRAVCASCRQKVDGRFLELSVRDTGPGIPAHVMDRMFEPFFSTKEVGRGSGMGLSLAHGIVHEHGGHILVDSLPNERTKVTVLLPAPAIAAAEVKPVWRAPNEPPSVRARLRGRVLVVDDEYEIREFMADLLGGWGLEVSTLADGAAARDAIAADPNLYDMVITDQTMPQLTGLALANEIARLRPALPVILYTGYAEDLSPQELREAGVLQLLRKPIEPAQFYPLLAAHLTAR